MCTKYCSREISRITCSFKEMLHTKSITLFFLATWCVLVRWRLRLLNFSLFWFIPTTKDFLTISSLPNWHTFLNSSLHCIKSRWGYFVLKRFYIIFFLIFLFLLKKDNKQKNMKCDWWGVTHNRLHVTHDAWCRLNSLSNIQLSSWNGLEVMMFWRPGGKGWPT